MKDVIVDSEGTVWKYNGDSFEPFWGLRDCSFLAFSPNRSFGVAVCHGEVFGWGDNKEGQLSGGLYSRYEIPTKVYKLKNIVSVSCAEAFILALDGDGVVWGCGDNCVNQLGEGNLTIYTPKPVHQNILPPIKHVRGFGRERSYAFDLENNCWTWGGKDAPIEPRNNFGWPFTPIDISVSLITGYIRANVVYLLDSEGNIWDYSSHSTQISPVATNIKQIEFFAENQYHNSYFLLLDQAGTVWKKKPSDCNSNLLEMKFPEPVIEIIGDYLLISEESGWLRTEKNRKSALVMHGFSYEKIDFPFKISRKHETVKKSARKI